MRLLSASVVTVKRYGEQLLDDFGNVTTSASQSFSIKCNWQPVPTSTKGEIAAILPSGIQISDTMVLFTKSVLRVDDETSGLVGDELTLDGVLYKVHLERNWSRYLSIKHREYIVVRKNKR
jgi:hypothetical protein